MSFFNKLSTNRKLAYTLIGVYAAVMIILIPFLIETSRHGSFTSIAEYLRHHEEEPLLYFNEIVALITVIGMYRMGVRADKQNQMRERISNEILARSEDAMRQYRYFEKMVNNTESAAVQLDRDHKIISFNPAFETLFGYSGKEVLGRELDNLIAGPDDITTAQQMTSTVNEGNVIREKVIRRCKDGSLVHVEITGIPVYISGEPMGAIGLYNDISLQFEAEQRIRENEARFRSLFEDSPISLWEEDFSLVKAEVDRLREQGVTDFAAYFAQNDDELLRFLKMVKVRDVNQATLDMFGARVKDRFLTGVYWNMTEESLADFHRELLSLISGKLYYEGETSARRVDGEQIDCAIGISVPSEYARNWSRVYVSLVDISERKRAEEKLRFTSFHDALTGLYNRMFFEEELIRLEEGRRFPVTVMVCDLDGLKQINDTEGHEAGDAAIRGIAHVLVRAFRNEDLIARIGGDEFAVILAETVPAMTAVVEKRLSRLLSLYNDEVVGDGLYRPLSLSFGIKTLELGQSLRDGLKAADERMYAMKSVHHAAE